MLDRIVHLTGAAEPFPLLLRSSPCSSPTTTPSSASCADAYSAPPVAAVVAAAAGAVMWGPLIESFPARRLAQQLRPRSRRGRQPAVAPQHQRGARRRSSAVAPAAAAAAAPRTSLEHCSLPLLLPTPRHRRAPSSPTTSSPAPPFSPTSSPTGNSSTTASCRRPRAPSCRRSWCDGKRKRERKNTARHQQHDDAAGYARTRWLFAGLQAGNTCCCCSAPLPGLVSGSSYYPATTAEPSFLTGRRALLHPPPRPAALACR